MKVIVRTPARLHLGILDTNGELGRLYGGIGVAIQHPRLVLEAESDDELVCEGLDAERVSAFAQRFLQRYPLPHGARLNLKASIPSHVGLGSGTQLALATGMALARLGNLKLTVPDIALAMQRGVHSGIGTAAFQYGGFVLDGGHRIAANATSGGVEETPLDKTVPPTLFHYPVPETWWFVIAVPNVAPGFSGEKESSAFSSMPKTPAWLAEKISRLVLMQMLPALIEEELLSFGRALTEIQRLVGDCFASAQGGRFANSVSDMLVEYFLNLGAAGAGQSSWGPTVYALTEGETSAGQIEYQAHEFLNMHGGGEAFRVHADNQGAQLEII